MEALRNTGNVDVEIVVETTVEQLTEVTQIELMVVKSCYYRGTTMAIHVNHPSVH